MKLLARGTGGSLLVMCMGCFSPNPNQLMPEDSTASAGSTSPSDGTASGAATSSGTSDSETTSEGGTSTVEQTTSQEESGEPVACDPTSPSDCSVPAPYCQDSECQPCGALDDNFCGSRPGTPACHPDSGLCAACVQDEDCRASSCADDYTCVECDEHSDCGETACDLFEGTCIDTSLVFWVDGTACAAPGPQSADPGFGSENQPYCWVTTALDQVGAGQSAVIHITGPVGSQPDISLSDLPGRTIAFIGFDGWTLGETATPITVDNGSRAFVSGAVVRGASGAGVTCSEGSMLHISDSLLDDNAQGISATDCESLTLERTQVQQTTGTALDVRGSHATLLSSMFVRNGESSSESTAVRFEDSTFEIRYSTVVGSLGAEGRASLYCSGSGGGDVRNSIMLSPSRPSVDCASAQVTGTATDTEPASGNGNLVLRDYDLYWFADLASDDAHLSDDTPFGGVARWGTGDPRSDFDGERRLAYPGLADFAGADQP